MALLAPLPQELVDMIIDYHSNDHETLKTLALVSKLCLAQSRKHLFSSIELLTSTSNPAKCQEHHARLRSILSRDPRIANYVRELLGRPLVPRDASDFGNARPATLHTGNRTLLDLVPSHLQAGAHDRVHSAEPAIPQPAWNIPKQCCVAFGAQVTDLLLVDVGIVDAVDDDMQNVLSAGRAAKLWWLGLEHVPAESIRLLYDALVLHTDNGPSLPSLSALQIGPGDADTVDALWGIVLAGRTTIQYFNWEYSHKVASVPPLATQPISLRDLHKLFAITFEVNEYPDEMDVDDFDEFGGLLALLETVNADNMIQDLCVKVNYDSLPIAQSSLASYDGWKHLDDLLNRSSFALHAVTVELDLLMLHNVEEAGEDTEGVDLEGLKEELEQSVRERLPKLVYNDLLTFNLKLRDMRILTWNINGVRTLPQYHPWTEMPTFNDILDALEADILCFQEMKSSRQGLTKLNAVPQSYHGFFSFPVRKTGYSGVATYVRTTTAVPIKAEEGLSAIIQPKPPLTSEERVSGPDAYPQSVIAADHAIDEELDYKDLDSEGRAVVLDFGLFVLINVYCPSDGSGLEERDRYKADFHRVLEARVKGLVEREGREVIVVGDLNVCAAVIDHCEGHLMVARGLAEGLQGEEGFWGKQSRRGLRAWLVAEDGTGGPMIDITRRLWPDRKGMYTCWNTKISARVSNYGTRIDYILITRGLLPWVKSSDIQPHVKGSDHCPVYLDLHDEIIDASGRVVKLKDVMGFTQDPPREPPRIASRFWPEFFGKQSLLRQFFSKPATPSPMGSLPSNSEPPEPPDSGSTTLEAPLSHIVADHGPKAGSLSPSECPSQALSDTDHDIPTLPSPKPLSTHPASQPSELKVSAEASLSLTTKRKLTAETLTRGSSSKKQKQKKDMEKRPGQATLSSFFAKPKVFPHAASPPDVSSSKGKGKSESRSEALDGSDSADADVVDLDADHRLAMLLASQADAQPPISRRSGNGSAEAWSTLLAPVQPPRCSVHGEPAKEFTVNKPGPNKGKRFFICSRPVGPGYDKGRSERLREHVDPQWRASTRIRRAELICSSDCRRCDRETRTSYRLLLRLAVDFASSPSSTIAQSESDFLAVGFVAHLLAIRPSMPASPDRRLAPCILLRR
ncbi:putative dna-(apurinic or apyrimidinic site) lyase [Lyophyllum shimeji]|uniref:DNA-(apurinic or apyrimidinic site) endonuclease 2 n=1 Tax=Lyophyllum shimeji TaxID=47721 RepID=A0A9P3USG3_LYOSH|nr:putative dna-(apurinic or apyrimidinic site) lyase [Lyophyllum shimeji]